MIEQLDKKQKVIYPLARKITIPRKEASNGIINIRFKQFELLRVWATPSHYHVIYLDRNNGAVENFLDVIAPNTSVETDELLKITKQNTSKQKFLKENNRRK